MPGWHLTSFHCPLTFLGESHKAGYRIKTQNKFQRYFMDTLPWIWFGFAYSFTFVVAAVLIDNSLCS